MIVDPIEWLENNFCYDRTVGVNGKFRLKDVPFLEEPIRAFFDPSITTIGCKTSAQAAKTQTGIMLAQASQAISPGYFMWVLPSLSDGVRFLKDRLGPSINLCEANVDLLPKGHKKIKTECVEFPFGTLFFKGAFSDGGLSGKPLKYLWLDELKNYPVGALESVRKRLSAKWRYKLFAMSTPFFVGDATDLMFLSGTQEVWMTICPNCKYETTLKWENIKWDKNDNKNLEIQSLRHECPNCKYATKDNAKDRRALCYNGYWKKMNENAPKDTRTFTWNSLLPYWNKWSDLKKEWDNVQAALLFGNKKPLQIFINQTLGESFDQVLSEKPVLIKESDYKIKDFENGELIENEIVRFMTIDRQAKDGEHWWVCIRAWSSQNSKLLYYGKCWSLNEVRDLQLKYGVKDWHTFEDCGYNYNKVMEDCATYGWTMLKGSDSEDFTHIDNKTKKRVKEFFSNMEQVNYNSEIIVDRITWSNPSVKDILSVLRSKPDMWQIPKGINEAMKKDDNDKDYHFQLNSEIKKSFINEKLNKTVYRWVPRSQKAANHGWDTECCQIVAALIYGGLINTSDEDNENQEIDKE
jgi:hypothetical protein